MTSDRPQAEGNGRRGIRRRHFVAAATLFAGLLLYGSWLPFDFRNVPLNDSLQTFLQILETGWRSGYTRTDVAVNVLVGVPLGFCLTAVLLFRNRRPLPIVAASCFAFALCGTLSLAAEFGQLWVTHRVPSPRDVAAQLVGALVGIAAWLWIGRRLLDEFDRLLAGGTPATKWQTALIVYAAGFTIYSFLPFDFVTSAGEIARKLMNGQIELMPFSHAYPSTAARSVALLLDVLVYIPIGAWASLAWSRETQRVRNAWSAITLAVLFAVLIESGQLLIQSRFSSITDLLCAVAGSIAGIAVVELTMNRQSVAAAETLRLLANPGFWGVLSLLYIAVLLAVFWSPFEFTSDEPTIRDALRRFADVPFRQMQAGGSDVGIFFTILRNLGWFLPLGLICGAAVRCATSPGISRRALLIVAVGSIAAIAVGIEAGQLLLPDRHANLTEAAIRAICGCAGLAIPLPPHSRRE